jgi:transcriptional regulator with XRE-family HTH domain
MRIHGSGTSSPSEDTMISAPVEIAERLARRLEDTEQVRSGLPLPAARQRLAARIGIAAGTLETLRRGRRKSLTDALSARLASAVVAELTKEIGALNHELELARSLGRRGGADLGEVAEIEADLASLRARMARLKSGARAGERGDR